jgi:hypothetical protein
MISSRESSECLAAPPSSAQAVSILSYLRRRVQAWVLLAISQLFIAPPGDNEEPCIIVVLRLLVVGSTANEANIFFHNQLQL